MVLFEEILLFPTHKLVRALARIIPILITGQDVLTLSVLPCNHVGPCRIFLEGIERRPGHNLDVPTAAHVQVVLEVLDLPTENMMTELFSQHTCSFRQLFGTDTEGYLFVLRRDFMKDGWMGIFRVPSEVRPGHDQGKFYILTFESMNTLTRDCCRKWGGLDRTWTWQLLRIHPSWRNIPNLQMLTEAFLLKTIRPPFSACLLLTSRQSDGFHINKAASVMAMTRLFDIMIALGWCRNEHFDQVLQDVITHNEQTISPLEILDCRDGDVLVYIPRSQTTTKRSKKKSIYKKIDFYTSLHSGISLIGKLAFGVISAFTLLYLSFWDHHGAGPCYNRNGRFGKKILILYVLLTTVGAQVEGEAHSLMVRSLTPTPATWTWTYIPDQDEPFDVQVPEHLADDLFEVRTRVCEHHDIGPQQDMVNYKIEPNIPTFAIESIKGYVQCKKSQLFVTTALILLDVEVYTNHIPAKTARPTPTAEWREATIVPTLTTRTAFLHAIGVGSFCNIPQGRCILKLGHHLWVSQDHRPRRILAGTYTIVKILQTLTELPFALQWTYAQRGCQLNEMVSLHHQETRPQRLEGTSRNKRKRNHGNSSLLDQQQDADDFSDHTSLMQGSGRPSSIPVPTLYGFCLHIEEPIRMLKSTEGAQRSEDYMRSQYYRQLDSVAKTEISVFYVLPQPSYFTHLSTEVFVLGTTSQIQVWQALIYLEVEFFKGIDLTTTMLPVMTHKWKKTWTLDYHLLRSTLLEQTDLQEICAQPANTCIVQMMGVIWPPDCSALRLVRDGAFVYVKVLQQHLQTICSPTPTPTVRRVTNGTDAIGEGSARSEETTLPVALLQIQFRISTRLYPTSFAHEAWLRLPPPGNGKHVRFGDTTIIEDETTVHTCTDLSSKNDFICGFCTDAIQETDNPMLRKLLHQIRFQPTFEKEEDSLPTCTSRPFESNLILPYDDQSHDDMSHKEGTDAGEDFLAGRSLPIAHPTANGSRYATMDAIKIDLFDVIGNDFDIGYQESTKTSTQGGICVANIWKLYNWLERHFTIGNHDYSKVPWKTASQQWMKYPIWQWQRPDALHFYVDGSDMNMTRGSGCILYVYSAGEWMRGGFVAHIATQANTAFQAELESHLLASKWTWDLLRWCEMQYATLPTVHYHYDNQAAANAVAGTWRCPESQRAYVAARSLQQLIRSQFHIEPDFLHDKSHCGDPGNEAADDIAKWITHQSANNTFWEVFYESNTQRNLQWLWVLKDDTMKAQLSGDQLMIPKPHAPFDMTVLTALQGQRPLQGDYEQVSWNITIASYNVMTLRDSDVSRGSPGTIESLFRQLHEAGHQLVFLQETRLRRSVHKSNPWYFVLQTPPVKGGQGGLLIGLSKTLYPCSDANQNPLPWKDEYLSLIYGDSNLLIAKIDHPGLRVLAINGHLPHTGHENEKLQQWWHKLDSKIPSHLRSMNCILAVDSNARIGSLTSEAIGPRSADEQTYGGGLLHQWLTDYSMWIPSTFDGIHSGNDYTWTHPNGSTSRIDFLAIPQLWKSQKISSKVNYALSANGLLHDHHAVELSIQGHTTLNFSSTKSCGRKCHKIDFEDPQAIFKLKQNLKRTPSFAWDLDVHRHYEGLNRYIWKTSKKLTTKDSKPRKDYLSPETWNLVLDKKLAKQEVFAQQKILRHELLTVIFAAWKFQGNVPFGLQDVKEARKELAIREHDFKQKSYLAQRSIRNEDEVFFAQFAANLTQADNPQKQRELWRELQRYLPKNQERKRQLAAHKFALLADQWPEYLCELEAGYLATPLKIYERCLARQNSLQPVLPTLEELPTMLQVEQSLLATKCRKSGGLDGIPPDILRHCAPELAQPCWQIMTKQLSWQTEAIQWKGGELKMIPKPSADLAKCNGFRGIMLTSVIGKKCQAILRQQMEKAISPGRPSGQLGGFRHKESLYGAHIVRTNARIAYSSKTPHALIFLDVRTAYHHLIRQTVTGTTPANADELHAIQEKARLAGKSLSHAREKIFQEGHLKNTEASPFLQSNIREANADTWTWIAGRTIHTTRGSRPGSPLADICFMTSMQEVAEGLEDFLGRLPKLSLKIAQLNIDGSPIFWADDIVIQLVAGTNEELLDLVPEVASFTHELFESRGFDINYGRSKTEVLLTLCGENASLHRRALLREAAPSCGFSVKNQQLQLRVEATYKHLGCQQEAGGALNCEISRRISLAWSAFRGLRRLLCGSTLSCSTRLRLLHVLIFTKLFYGSGTWYVLPQKTMLRIAKCYIGLVRCVTKQVFVKGKQEKIMSNDELLAQYNLPDVRTILARERLLYAYRAWHHGGQALWKALDQEHAICHDSWMHGLLADLKWIREVLGPTFGHDFNETTKSWDVLPKSRWKSAVNTAVRRHLLQEQIAWKLFKGSLSDAVEEQNLDDGWMCFCAATFSTKRALRTHQTTKHHNRTIESKFTAGTICPCCLLQFWTRGRLMQHLRYIGRAGTLNRCYNFLYVHQYQADPEGTEEATILPMKGLRRRDAIRCEGPLPF